MSLLSKQRRINVTGFFDACQLMLAFIFTLKMSYKRSNSAQRCASKALCHHGLLIKHV